jgi:hypothetical protein
VSDTVRLPDAEDYDAALRSGDAPQEPELWGPLARERVCVRCEHRAQWHLINVWLEGPGCKRMDCQCDEWTPPALTGDVA